MEDSFVQKIKNTINKYKMLDSSDKIVLGLSGGTDSVSLFHAFRMMGVSFICIHINHNLRGNESDTDEKFVVTLCKKYGVTYEIVKADVIGYAKEKKITTEEAGRKIRYNAFSSALAKHQYNKIAVAHNTDDNAETILMRFFRGTGSRGLSGIPHVNGNIIRPLLDINRNEIVDFLTANDFEYRVDESNLGNDYTRNKIRNVVIPYIGENFNRDIVNTLHRNSRISSEEWQYIEKQTQTAFDKCKTKNGLMVSELKKLDLFVIKRVIFKALAYFNNVYADTTAKHIDMIMDLLEAVSGKKVQTAHGVVIERSYNELIFVRQETEFSLELVMNDYTLINGLNLLIYLGDTIPTDCDFYEAFDKSKILGKVKVRSLLEGDKITLHNLGRKKLSDYFTDKKIPRHDRMKIPLLCDDETVIWIIGHRVSSVHVAKKISDIVYVGVKYLEV